MDYSRLWPGGLLVLVVLLSGHSGAAHVSALAPIAVLLAAVAGAGRQPGRVLALIVTAAVVLAFTSSAGDWYGDGALVLGVTLLTAALLRSGASRELRRRMPLDIVFWSVAGVLMLLWGAGLAVSLPGALGLFLLVQPWIRLRSGAVVPGIPGAR